MSGRKARAARQLKAAAPVQRYRAGQLTYNGDQSDMVGQFRGPTTYGSYVVATDAVYDAETDLTVVTFVHATQADVYEAQR